MTVNETPRSLGYRWPAEWETHSATWLSWPHNRETWSGVFDSALAEYIQFAKTIASFEPVHICAAGAAADVADSTVGALSNVTIHGIATNDAWIRDHGPIFLASTDGTSSSSSPALVDWRFNSWGEKYPPFDADNLVPKLIARAANRKHFANEFILEGGAIDGNGKGIALTTASCVLNESRNQRTTAKRFERLLENQLAIDTVVWLEGDIPGDDTDGHVDQMARFVSEKTVVLATDERLPALAQNKLRLKNSGLGIALVQLPMPQQRQHRKKELPASYANFYILNGAVIVPTFDDPNDARALSILAEQFDDREVIGLPATSLIVGLGAFHCLTQQEPCH